MITDVQLSALANWLGSLTMILIVLYHVSLARAKEVVVTTAISNDVAIIASYPWPSPVMDVPTIFLVAKCSELKTRVEEEGLGTADSIAN